MTHLSRLAEEIVLWASAEFGLVRLDDAFSTGSSIMPQKAQPGRRGAGEGQERARDRQPRAGADAAQGQPLAYNRDLQEDKEPLFDTVDTLLASLAVMAAMLPSLRFDAERGRAAAVENFALATDLADQLVRRGVPFREAHAVIGALVARCEQEGRTFEDLSADEFREAHPVFAEEPPALGLEAALAARSATGGTAPEAVERQREAARARLAAEEAE